MGYGFSHEDVVFLAGAAGAAATATRERPTLLLIDGHSVAYRAFYALPAENFKTVTGQTTNAHCRPGVPERLS